MFVDGESNPVTPLKLEITQKNHTFKYGANLFVLDEFPSLEYCTEHNIMPKAHCLNYANFHP